MLVYAGIRNTPKPLPFLNLDPVDDFWCGNLAQHCANDGKVLLQDRILEATAKLAEEIAWDYDIEKAPLALSVNDEMSFEELYGKWYVTVMKPCPVGEQV
jgi:hypothetical protein